MNIGTVHIHDNGAVASDLRAITSGMVGATVRLIFDHTWDGYSKTLVWQAGDVTRDDTTASGIVPAEVLAVAGAQLRVGVCGVCGDVVTPTVWAKLGKILPGADPSGDESTDPSLPVWVQVQEDIDRLEAAADAAVQSAAEVAEGVARAEASAEQAEAAAVDALTARNGATFAATQASSSADDAISAAAGARESAEAAAASEALVKQNADRAAESAKTASEAEGRIIEMLGDVGDIEATLDGILAIQAELIGGDA